MPATETRPPRMRCRPSPWRSTHELLDVELDASGAPPRRLVAKALPERPPPGRPGHLHDPLRELHVYRHLLEGLDVDAPGLVGVRRIRGRRWMLVERVEGDRLVFEAAGPAWEAAAAWAARLHLLGREVAGAGTHRHLLAYDAPAMALWMDRAEAFAGGGRGGRDARRRLRWLRPRHARAVERLAELPRTLLHGELSPANVLVVGGVGAPRIRVVDWELAGIGPGALDLAALLAGSWSAGERARLAGRYARTWEAGGGRARDVGAELAAASLHVCVRWLGWAAGWTAPPDQRRDWLEDAVRFAEEGA